MADESELRQRAFEAVRGATEWLIGLRRSADLEGFEPYGDGLTGYESGFVSMSEGLTTLSLVRSYEQENDVDLGSSRLPDELYGKDLEWLLSQIEAGKYRGTPYLEDDATDNFTDGVSFSTSVLMEALGLSDHGVPVERIEAGLSRNLDWFLDNAHNEHLESDDFLGWSWCGFQEMQEDGGIYPPQTYFTWSACIALTDLLAIMDRLDSDREDEVRSTLERAKRFLVEGYRVDPGWIEFRPVGGLEPHGFEAIDPSPSLLSTCYTIGGLCYMQNRIDGIELSENERDLIEGSMNDYVVARLADNVENVYKHSTWYRCRREGEDYYEGSAPYTILNTLIEYAEAFGDDRDEIISLEHRLVEQILTECWGGTPGSRESREAGFRHFENPAQIESSENPTVVYATEVAVESLLYFGIEAPETPSLESRIVEEFRQAEENILDLLHQGDGTIHMSGEDECTVREVEEMNKNLLTRRDRLGKVLERQFGNHWTTVSRKLSGEMSEKIANLTKPIAEVHVDEFLDVLLDRCYFEGDPSEFRAALSRFREDWAGYLLSPYAEALDGLASLGAEEIRDPVRRKGAIDEVLDELEEDITRGKTPEEIAEALGDADR